MKTVIPYPILPVVMVTSMLLLGGCTATDNIQSSDNDTSNTLPVISSVERKDKKIEAEESLADTVQPTVEVATMPSPQIASKQNRLGRTMATEVQPMMAPASMAVMGMGSSGVIAPPIRDAVEPTDRENYAAISDNRIQLVTENPVSTFSIDVDTGAYSNSRRFLQQGRMPHPDAVRAEEFINYFHYDYPLPEPNAAPFSITTEIAPTPWNKNSHLLHIGLQGYQVPTEQLPPANLVFLIDVSGSMHSADKLPLLQKGLGLLVKQMDKEDTISLVVYAGASGVVLPPTSGDQKATILAALDGLTAGGSTNGAAGITLAYQMARQAFKPKGINRILLATDGDFNVGTTNFTALKQLVEKERRDGIALTTLGFGSGNYNEQNMEQLADAGNGNYGYIDSLKEANKVLVEQMGSTLHTIAKDVKIQIEFNPQQVSEYRLIGYENRLLQREDFNNDKVDAGEIGAGHTVTALYEITLAGKPGSVTPLRYQSNSVTSDTKTSDELAFLRLRYKQPDSDNSTLLEQPILKQQIIAETNSTSDSWRFAAAVAAFAQKLRGDTYVQEYSYDDIAALARTGRGNDTYGYRGEFVQLVSLAKTVSK